MLYGAHSGLPDRDPGRYVGRHRLPPPPDDTPTDPKVGRWLSGLLHKKQM